MKTYSLLTLFIVPIFLSACGPQSTTNQTGSASNQGQAQNQAQEKFSLKNALTLGQSLKCTYDQEGKTVTTLIKGNKYKVTGEMVQDQGDGGVITDSEYMYIWNNENKMGTKINLKVMQELGKDAQSSDKPEAETFDFNKWAEEVEGKHNVDCQPYLVTDAEFTPPSDIKFQDMTEFFQKVGEMGKQLQANPSGVPSAEDVEKMGDLFKGMGDEAQSPVDESSSEE